jgi:6-phosphogluconolactonase
MTIIKTPSSKLFINAADRLSKEIKDTLSNHNVVLYLSGGSALALYPYLAKALIKLCKTSVDDDMMNLAILQVDERFEPKNDEDSNALQIEKTGLWRSCDKTGVEHYMITKERVMEDAVDFYNTTLKKFNTSRMPQFNKDGTQRKKTMYQIGIFGIGEDGHTAGLLPGYQKIWDVDESYVGYENEGKFKKRITMTPALIRQMDFAIVVAKGEKKKKVVKKLVDPKGERLDEFPAGILRKIKTVEVYTDN